MQSRYRDLLPGVSATSDKLMPQDRVAIDAEMAKLEGRMRTDRARGSAMRSVSLSAQAYGLRDGQRG